MGKGTALVWFWVVIAVLLTASSFFAVNVEPRRGMGVPVAREP